MNLGDKEIFSVAELAELMGLSRQTITRMFEDEPGVLIIERPETLRKRKFRTIRIPRAVAARVFRACEVQGNGRTPAMTARRDAWLTKTLRR